MDLKIISTGDSLGQWRQEDRNFTTNTKGQKMALPVMVKGEHDKHCREEEHGWLCEASCTIETMPTMATRIVAVDHLMAVEREVERMRGRVYWAAVRVSHRLTYTNGRCQIPRDELINREIFYAGTTWTKWGARRAMEEAIKSDSVST